MNPSVTISLFAIGKISFLRALLYVLVQCAGAVAGSSCMKAVLPESMYGGLGHTTLAPDLLPLQGLAIEFFLGFLLLIVIVGVCDENRTDTKYTGALAIGLTVAFAHFAGIKFTGASVNGARTFGSAVVTGNWENHWVSWTSCCHSSFKSHSTDAVGNHLNCVDCRQCTMCGLWTEGGMEGNMDLALILTL